MRRKCRSTSSTGSVEFWLVDFFKGGRPSERGWATKRRRNVRMASGALAVILLGVAAASGGMRKTDGAAGDADGGRRPDGGNGVAPAA
jgi:hypothetical protein